jgi:hypothetical protein
MRLRRHAATVDAMTDTSLSARVILTEPPFSRPIRLTVAFCLAAAAVLTAIPQYLEQMLAGDLDREDQIAWGLAHHGFYRVEWLAAMLGSILLLIGVLGLWQVTRWSTPKLTVIGAVVLTWGISGQILSEAATYTSQVVAAEVFGSADAERLIAEGYLHDPGMIAGVLVPVIAGMFFGVILLAVALWRSAFPRVPVVLLALWPLWDFFGPSSLGLFTADLLLLVAGVWLGVVVARLPHPRWLGRDT